MIFKPMKYIISLLIFFSVINITEAKTINSFIVDGNVRISEESIKVFSGFNDGDDINQNELNIILKNLYETNFFKDVSVQIDNDSLIVTVKENPIIQEVLIEGFKREKLKESIYDILTLKNKSSYVEYIAKSDLQRIINELRVTGYYLSKVTSSIKQNENNTINLIYNINLGEKALIKKIKFIGDKKFKNRTLRRIIVSEESRFWKFLSNKKFLNKNLINLDERLLTSFYKNEGYYDAQVQSSSAKFINDKNFELTYNINAGQKFIFNKLDLVLPIDYDSKNFDEISSTFDDLKNTTYSLAKIEKILKKIDIIALSNQYEFISADVDEEIIDNNKLNLTFIIKETEKNYVERINIIGNSITRENVIRNSLFVDEGDAFNEILHNKSLNSIKGKGIFAKVDSQILDGSSPNMKIIEIEVEEQATGEISAGAGLGSSGGTLGFGLKENNWLGQGISLNSSIEIRENSLRGEITFDNPNFRNSDNSLYTSISSVNTDNMTDSGYETTVTGVSVGSNFEKYENLYLFPTLSVTFESLTTSSDASANLKKQQGDYFETLFKYVLDYDKRNRRYQPSDGHRSTFRQEIPLVSENWELRNSYTIANFTELYDGMIGSVSFGVSAINSMSGDDVKISKRLYIQEKKLRGFEKGKVGPKENQDFVGGNYSSTLNLSTTLPNLFPDSENTDFKIFFDAATLWGIDYSSTVKDTGTIRTATGVGIDWFTPIGPLSFSLSQPLTKDSSDVTEVFRFNLGTTF